MTKREIYKEILDTVSGICEVSVEYILCGVRNCEVVEARCIAAHYLMRYGVLPADVVRFSNGEVKHRHCVTKSASSFHDRCRLSFSFRCDAESVGNILKSKYEPKGNQTRM